MFPALFGCRTPSERCRVRGWAKHGPSRLLGALPKRAWLKRLRRLGLEGGSPSGVMCPTKIRPPRAAGSGPGSGMTRCAARMGSSCGGSAGGGAASTSACCRALMGAGFWWGWAMGAWSCRWTLPCGGLILWTGAPCREKLTGARVDDERLAAFGRRGLALPAPMGVADSGFGDSKLRPHGRDTHQGTLLVEGKASDGFTLAAGRQVKGPT